MNREEKEIVKLMKVLVRNKEYIQSFDEAKIIYVEDYELELDWGVCIFVGNNTYYIDLDDHIDLWEFGQETIQDIIGDGSPRNGMPNLYRVEKRWGLIEWIIKTLEERDEPN